MERDGAEWWYYVCLVFGLAAIYNAHGWLW